MFIVSLLSSSYSILNLKYAQETGIMDWEKLAQRDLDASRTSFYLIVQLFTLCADVECQFGTITDGQQSAVINYTESEPEHGAFVVNVVTEPVRAIIASFVHHVARRSELCSFDDPAPLVPCRGAINQSVENTAQSARDTSQAERCFRDFDLFTMQRNPIEYNRFYEWKRSLQSTTALLDTGAVLDVKCNIMPHDGRYEACSIVPWRSPYPNHKPPHETLDTVMRIERPRHTDIDTLLDANSTTKFMITQVIRTSHNGFSQVFLGHLGGSSRQICLKLFDERLFPMPQHPVYREDTVFRQSPERRLLDLNFADDMMRREEAVYNDRLRHLQGSMIPHCYGFHMVGIDAVIKRCPRANLFTLVCFA
jgi:hypothetical protein